jgi:hypothetical protein
MIVRPPGDNHWRGLFEVAQGIDYALKYLDKFQSARTGGRQIVFNAHRLPTDEELPNDAIIFNAEQIPTQEATGSLWAPYIARLRKHIVWDYSQTNIDRMQAFGVERTVHCKVGYYPQEPLPAREQDIDVLLYGSMNERRSMIAFDLAAKSLKVETLFDVYGAERDAWIARSKIVLNVHYYEKPIFEIFRVSHLLANKKCVVTEDGGCDSELEKLAQKACVYKPYSLIADECKYIIDNEFEQHAGESGHRVFKKISQIDEVKAALEVFR